MPDIKDYANPVAHSDKSNAMEIQYDRRATVDDNMRIHIPHHKLLKGVGKSVHHLMLNIGPGDIGIKQEFEEVLRPICVQRVLGLCPNLEILKLTNVDFFNLSSATPINKSIKLLIVECGSFFPGGFNQLRDGLPSSVEIMFLNCDIGHTNIFDMSKSISRFSLGQDLRNESMMGIWFSV